MSVSLLSGKLIEIQQLALAFVHWQPISVCQVCPFWQDHLLCQGLYTTLPVVPCQSDMLNVYHSPAHFFVSSPLSFPVQHQLQRMSQLLQSLVPLQFPLLDVAIAIDATSYHWTFYF